MSVYVAMAAHYPQLYYISGTVDGIVTVDELFAANKLLLTSCCIHRTNLVIMIVM